jgi:hypothetical protein
MLPLHSSASLKPPPILRCAIAQLTEGINGYQPHNRSTFLLLATPTRSAHGRAGATGSVRRKLVRCNSDIDQLEKNLTAPQKFATSADMAAKKNSSLRPAER